MGGTQRLPRLIGLPNALDIILAGKTVNGSKAKKIKLIDKLIASALLNDQCEGFLQQLRDPNFRDELKANREPRAKTQRIMNQLLETSWGRAWVIKQARKSVLKSSKGFYPAPLAVLDVVATKCSFNEGISRELEAFSKLAVSDISKNLIELFFLTEAVKKSTGADYKGEITPPQHAAVLGAGVMGGGIAWLLSQHKLSVRMKDISWDAVALGYAQASNYFAQLKKRRRLQQGDIDRAMNRIGGSVNYEGFAHVEVVIEAIVENITIKKQLLAETETHISDSTLLCSNTSALSITEMASVLNRPENFCGMHFFNPVNRMPLVEIIRGEKSSDETIARAVAMVKSWGKTAIVVANCPGFLVNRILLPYMNEAAYLLQEGADIEMIDRVITEFGMPMGPFQLADEVGIDVGYKVAKTLQEGFGSRMAVSPLLTTVYEDLKLLGKKGGAGFYKYQGKEVTVNPLVANFTGTTAKKAHSEEDIIDRLMIIMVNEAAHCLQENIVANAGQLDLAMVMGTGFPPWRGGLCRWADSVGLETIVNKCNALNEIIPERYQVSPYLTELVAAQKGFYAQAKEVL
ncbi:3-hydroxyacyl-CoA dehydrogenase NAD-binding domain-containing protein [Psychromonas sp. MME1]|uniref:3-hydroxyacyl-CoA dehydrogenase NAD-binding domain-containing protein n=1 Tax=Psychromonas sp. MME1 TaxID=3231032 RepID=UPI0034E2A2D1